MRALEFEDLDRPWDKGEKAEILEFGVTKWHESSFLNVNARNELLELLAGFIKSQLV